MFGQPFRQTLLNLLATGTADFCFFCLELMNLHISTCSVKFFLEIWHIVIYIELNWIYYLHGWPGFEFFFSNSKKLKHGWLSTNLWLEIISEPSINCHYRWGHFLKWKIRTILQHIMFQECQCQTVRARWKRKTSHHSSSAQFFTVSVYGSTRPRAGGPGLTISLYHIWLKQGVGREMNHGWHFFFSIVNLLLCFREESHSEINYRLKKKEKKVHCRLLETDRTRTKKMLLYRENF